MATLVTGAAGRQCCELPRRGTAMEYNVRGRLGLQGLVPPAETGLQQEIDRARAAIAKCCTALDKYQVCTGTLQDPVPVYHARMQEQLELAMPALMCRP